MLRIKLLFNKSNKFAYKTYCSNSSNKQNENTNQQIQIQIQQTPKQQYEKSMVDLDNRWFGMVGRGIPFISTSILLTHMGTLTMFGVCPYDTIGAFWGIIASVPILIWMIFFA